MLTIDTIKDAVAVVKDPELNKGLLELGMLRDISVEEGTVKMTLALTTSVCPKQTDMVDELKKIVYALPEVSNVLVELTTLGADELQDLFAKHPLQGLKKVQHVLAVASGKGGVGKTTIAVNLALALAAEGLSV